MMIMMMMIIIIIIIIIIITNLTANVLSPVAVVTMHIHIYEIGI
jgi:hypothetical protein